jgi:acetyl esterase/lipase
MPPQAAELYAQWFVNPTAALADSLLSYNNFVQKADSLARSAVASNRGPSGTHSQVAVDTFGASYTIGWKAPDKIRFDTAYPLIVYLHGGTGTTLSTKGERAYDMLSSLSDTFSLFLASPSANRDAPWWSPAGMSRVLQTVRFMTLHYPINPDKIFLAGVSDGATGCYCAANTICDPFAGFIAVSGYGGMLVSLGQNLYPRNLMQRPILNINAGQDRIYPFQMVMQFLSWLDQNGVNVQHREYPEEKHGFDYRSKEYGNLANIVRTWSRPRSRSAISWVFTPQFPNYPPHCIGWEFGKDGSGADIVAFWTDDTLELRCSGLSSVTCSFDNLPSKGRFVSINGAGPKPLTPTTSDGRMLLSQTQHRLFPIATPQTIYKIKIAL